MTLCPQTTVALPEETTRIAYAAYPPIFTRQLKYPEYATLIGVIISVKKSLSQLSVHVGSHADSGKMEKQ